MTSRTVHFLRRLTTLLLFVACLAGSPIRGAKSNGFTIDYDFGTVRPGEAAIGMRAVQLYVTGQGPYKITAIAPHAFHGIDDPSKSIPVERLRWRIHGSEQPWQEVPSSEPMQVLGRSPSVLSDSHVIGIDYMFQPTWDDLPSKGGYALDVTYRVAGEAVLHVSTASPNPAPAGEQVTFSCWRATTDPEDFSVTFHSQDGDSFVGATWHQTRPVQQVDFAWLGLQADGSPLSPGEYTYRLVGSRSGLCGAGLLAVSSSADYKAMSIIEKEIANRPEPLDVKVAIQSRAGVGEWVQLKVDVKNASDQTAGDIHVLISLPPGLKPVGADGTESLYYIIIPVLQPYETWTHDLDLFVTPEAKPGTIDVRVEASMGDVGVRSPTFSQAAFAPQTDDWIRPASRLLVAGDQGMHVLIDGVGPGVPGDPTRKNDVTQGWHVLWTTDALGRHSRPYIFDIPSAAPSLHQIERPSFMNQDNGLLTGFSFVHLSSDDWRVRLAGEGRVRLGHWSLQSHMAHKRGDSLRPSNLRLVHSQGFFAEVASRPQWDESAPADVTFGWHSPRHSSAPGRIRLSQTLSPDRQPKTDVAWEHTNPQGGVQVKHSFIPSEKNTIQIGIWRKKQGLLPSFRIDSVTDGQGGRVRFGLTHGAATPWGTWRAGARWQISPSPAMNLVVGHIGWEGHVSGWSAQPYGDIIWSPGDISTTVGWQATRHATTNRFSLGRSTRRAGIHYRWDRREQLPQGARHLTISLDRAGYSMRVDLENISYGPWHVEGALEAENAAGQSEYGLQVIARHDTTAWHLRAGRMKDAKEVRDELRLDLMQTFSLLGRTARGGVLGGARKIAGSVFAGENKIEHTTSAFIGGWGEMAWIQPLWAGVAGAKWNSEGRPEYDVYLRYELTPQLWIKAGWHVAPGAIGLFGDNPAGPYVSAMWAFQSAW